VPPHWWIPIRPGNPDPAEHVRAAVSEDKLKSVWQTPDGQQLYALIEADRLDYELMRAIGANGRPMAVEELQVDESSDSPSAT
jgi:hypothetical protein